MLPSNMSFHVAVLALKITTLIPMILLDSILDAFSWDFDAFWSQLETFAFGVSTFLNAAKYQLIISIKRHTGECCTGACSLPWRERPNISGLVLYLIASWASGLSTCTMMTSSWCMVTMTMIHSRSLCILHVMGGGAWCMGNWWCMCKWWVGCMRPWRGWQIIENFVSKIFTWQRW